MNDETYCETQVRDASDVLKSLGAEERETPSRKAADILLEKAVRFQQEALCKPRVSGGRSGKFYAMKALSNSSGRRELLISEVGRFLNDESYREALPVL